MNNFKRGTPGFGVFLGALFLAAGALIMLIGFWKTLALAALFTVGYFLGSVQDKAAFMKEAMDKVVPDKKDRTIDFRKEVEMEQANESASELQDAPEDLKEDCPEVFDFRKEVEAEQAAMFPPKDEIQANETDQEVEE